MHHIRLSFTVSVDNPPQRWPLLTPVLLYSKPIPIYSISLDIGPGIEEARLLEYMIDKYAHKHAHTHSSFYG